MAITLTKGQRYDTSKLQWCGYTEGDGSGHFGYGWQHYFQMGVVPGIGVYVGADIHGIEPLFEDDAPRLLSDELHARELASDAGEEFV